jgi:hypothetical protein
MPALPSVPKVIRFDLRQSYQGNVGIRNRLFISYSGTLSNADLTTLCNTVATSYGTNIKPLQNVQHSLIGVDGTDLTSSSAAQVVTTQSQVGTVNVGNVPDAVAAIIKFKIARRYRGGHPRFYLTGRDISQFSVTDTFTAGFISSLASGFQAWITAIETAPPAAVGTLVHVNVSYFLGFTNKTFPSGRVHPVPTLRGTPVVDTVLSYSVNPKPGSQRRRTQQSP